MITSNHNPKIQLVRALNGSAKQRREQGMFVIEGVRLAEEGLQSGWEAQLVLTSSDLGERGLVVAQGFAGRGVAVEEVAPSVMQAASDTQTPQGIFVILAARSLPLPELLHFVLIADTIRDPGNLGTILRTASAAGVQAVLLPPGTTDAFAPKVVRAAMGAHFRLPILPLSWPEIGGALQPQDHSLSVYLADPGGELAYTQVDFRTPCAIIVGGEAEGASQEAREMAVTRISIPMAAQVESLNAAVAAGVLLFEAARQRAVISEQ